MLLVPLLGMVVQSHWGTPGVRVRPFRSHAFVDRGRAGATRSADRQKVAGQLARRRRPRNRDEPSGLHAAPVERRRVDLAGDVDRAPMLSVDGFGTGADAVAGGAGGGMECARKGPR